MSRGKNENEDAGSPAGEEPVAQSAAVPIRRDDHGISVCLVTSLRKKRWIVPKGIIDPGETPEEAALKEAFEEAGLKGHIVGDPLGTFKDSKGGSDLDVTVFLMEVDESLERWEESHLRERRFVPLAEAENLIDKNDLKKVLKRVRMRLGEEAGSGSGESNTG